MLSEILLDWRKPLGSRHLEKRKRFDTDPPAGVSDRIFKKGKRHDPKKAPGDAEKNIVLNAGESVTLEYSYVLTRNTNSVLHAKGDTIPKSEVRIP